MGSPADIRAGEDIGSSVDIGAGDDIGASADIGAQEARVSSADSGPGKRIGSVGDSMGGSCFIGFAVLIWLPVFGGSEAEVTVRSSLSRLRLNCARRLLSSATALAAATRSLKLRTFSSSVFARAFI